MSAQNGTGRAGSEPGSPAPPLTDRLASSGATAAKEPECWCVSQQGDAGGGFTVERTSPAIFPTWSGNGDETEVKYVSQAKGRRFLPAKYGEALGNDAPRGGQMSACCRSRRCLPLPG